MSVRSILLRTSSMAPVERMVTRSRLFRPLVRRFIVGDTFDAAMAAISPLIERGFGVSLDMLGENVRSERDALAVRETYLRMLDSIESSGSATAVNPDEYVNGKIENINISIKLTQCGLDISTDTAEQCLVALAERAAQAGGFVRVDMESSEYTQRTLDLMLKVAKSHPNVGTVLQSSLFRTKEDLEACLQAGIRVRLVKGAYLEPSSVAYAKKADVDAAYVELGKRMLEKAVYPAFGTHDERIIVELNEAAKVQQRDKSSFEYQMLYGIRRDLQQRLLDAGYPVRVYVPYGDKWYPYFSRRLAERPANVWFIVKAIFRG